MYGSQFFVAGMTAGDGKGSRFPGPSSYIYVATDRQFKEVTGFLPGQEAQVRNFTIRHDATKRGGTAETGSAWHGDRVARELPSATVALISLGEPRPVKLRP